MCQPQNLSPKAVAIWSDRLHVYYRIQIPDQEPPRYAVGYLYQWEEVWPQDQLTIEPNALRRALEGTGTLGLPLRLLVRRATEFPEEGAQTQV